jgi:hypothetical protein
MSKQLWTTWLTKIGYIISDIKSSKYINWRMFYLMDVVEYVDIMFVCTKICLLWRN